MNRQASIPYRGLRYFDWTDADDFYGRDTLSRQLLQKMHSQINKGHTRFLGIIGPSGSGKSSLARAGLLSRLMGGARSPKEGIKGSEDWPFPGVVQPGAQPIEALAEVLAAFLNEPSSTASLAEELKRSHETLADLVHDKMKKAPKQAQWMLLVDQFEEVYTLCSDEEERRAFVENLYRAATRRKGRVFVVMTLRADFYGKCALDPRLNELLSQHQLLLRPMKPKELTAAIIQPAVRSGCSFESDLVDLLCQEVSERPGALPLLQTTLLELWRQRTGRRLTKEAYLSFGGLKGALERRAEEIYSTLNEEQQEVCRRMFLALVQAGENAEDTKRKASLPSLLSLGASAMIVREVIYAFSEPTARLLTVEGGWAGPSAVSEVTFEADTTVEVSHEALLVGWERLQDWLAAHKEALFFLDKYKRAAKTWKRATEKEQDGLLWSDPELAVAEEWSKKHTYLLDQEPEVTAFLEASVTRREADAQKESAYLEERQHALEDRAKILQTKESINQRKSDFLEQKEVEVQKQRGQVRVAWFAFAAVLAGLVWVGSQFI